LEQLQKLPFLTREAIQQNIEGLLAKNYPPSRLVWTTTSGSTGMPLKFYSEKNVAGHREWAFIANIWSRWGYRFGDKMAMFSSVMPPNKLWLHKGVGQTLFSATHMTDETLPGYIEQLVKLKPKYLKGFPSVLSQLAKFMLNNNIDSFPSVHAVFCGSENMYNHQRMQMLEAFQCPVATWYGHTERAVLAGECELSIYQHVFPQYGIIELIGKDGSTITEEDEMGEIVATGLTNREMPMIRYRTGDMGVYAGEQCECGREYPLLKRIEGRRQDFVVTKTGSLVSLTALFINQHFKAFSHIQDLQLQQNKKGELKLLLVKGEGFTVDDEKEIVSRMVSATGNQIMIGCEYVNEIPRTKAGKHLFLIQHLEVA